MVQRHCASSAFRDHARRDETSGIVFFFVTVLVGLLAKLLTRKVPLPYTVLLMLIGITLGALQAHSDLGHIGDSIDRWVRLDPHLLLIIFLPALIFGSAFAVDFHTFGREIPQMLLLAVPGVIMSSVLTALFAMYALPYDWDMATGLAFGAMMSATDPVAVVALLRELGAPKRLSLLIEGESLLNDGTAIVIFTVFRDAMIGDSRNAGETFAFFLQLSVGGAAVGFVAGLATVYTLGRFQFDIVSQISVTLLACYGVFVLCESTPPIMSGVLGVLVLGLVMASSGRTAVREHQHMHSFWEMVEHFANTGIFVLAGIVMFVRGFDSSSVSAEDWGYLVLLYITLHAVRLLMVGALQPALTRSGYGLKRAEAYVLSFSGLRGAVGLLLALIVDSEERIDEDTRQRFVFHMAGIALLTLLVNGSTAGSLVRYLGLTTATKASRVMFNNALSHIAEHQEFTIRKLQHDEFSMDADWELIHNLMPTVLASIRDGHTATTSAASKGMLAKFTAALRHGKDAVLELMPSPMRRRGSSAGDAGLEMSSRSMATVPGTTPQINPTSDDPRVASPPPHDTGAGVTPLPGGAPPPAAVVVVAPPPEKEQEASMAEARHRLLNLIKSRYWELFEHGRVGSVAVEELVDAASECQDDVTKPLDEWSHLDRVFKEHTVLLRFGSVLGSCFGRANPLFRALSFEFDVASTFITAHKGIESVLAGLIRDPVTLRRVVAERDAMVLAARRKLERLSEPATEMIRAIKTKRAIQALLMDTKNTAMELHKLGEIERREYDNVVTTVNAMHTVLKIPVAIHADEARLMREVGYLDYLDDETFDKLMERAQDNIHVFPEGATIIPEGVVSGGFFIITRGIVNVISRDARVRAARGGSEVDQGRRKDRRQARSAPRGTLETKGTPGVEVGDVEVTVGGRHRATASAMPAISAGKEGSGSGESSTSLRRLRAGVSQRFARRFRSKSGGLKEPVVVDRLHKGAVVGALSMLTKKKTLVEYKCETAVMAVYLEKKRVEDLLTSKPHESGGPLRRVAPLEQMLCRMAGVLVAETAIPEFKHLSSAQLRQMFASADLFRPLPLYPIRIQGKAILLTGAQVRPRAKGHASRLRAATCTGSAGLVSPSGQSVDNFFRGMSMKHFAPETTQQLSTAKSFHTLDAAEGDDAGPRARGSSFHGARASLTPKLDTCRRLRAAGALEPVTVAVDSVTHEVETDELPPDGIRVEPVDALHSAPNDRVFRVHSGNNHVTLRESDFVVEKAAVRFLDSRPHTTRWFSPGTRLLVIPLEFASMFNEAHETLMRAIQLQKHLSVVTKSMAADLPACVGPGVTPPIIQPPFVERGRPRRRSLGDTELGSPLPTTDTTLVDDHAIDTHASVPLPSPAQLREDVEAAFRRMQGGGEGTSGQAPDAVAVKRTVSMDSGVRTKRGKKLAPVVIESPNSTPPASPGGGIKFAVGKRRGMPPRHHHHVTEVSHAHTMHSLHPHHAVARHSPLRNPARKLTGQDSALVSMGSLKLAPLANRTARNRSRSIHRLASAAPPAAAPLQSHITWADVHTGAESSLTLGSSLASPAHAVDRHEDDHARTEVTGMHTLHTSPSATTLSSLHDTSDSEDDGSAPHDHHAIGLADSAIDLVSEGAAAAAAVERPPLPHPLHRGVSGGGRFPPTPPDSPEPSPEPSPPASPGGSIVVRYV